MTRARTIDITVLLTTLLLGSGVVLGRQAPPAAEATPAAPATPSGDQEAGPVDETPPSLDELLGLEEDRQASSAEEAAERETQRALEQHLSEAEVRDAFALALENMRLSADLLDQEFDTGLGTQRVQEDILRKLDQLIEFAKQQQQQQQSSSSSSSSSSSQQQQQQQPGQQQSRGAEQQAAERQEGQASNAQEGDPPPRQEGDINTIMDESRTEWGNLPPRLRQELLQGRNDRYSQLYKRLTEEYYRRLAEEGTP